MGVPRDLVDELFDALFNLIDVVTSGPSEEDKKTLFYRLGGLPALQKVVDGMY